MFTLDYHIIPDLNVGDLVTTSQSYDCPDTNWLRDEGFILGEVLKLEDLSVKVHVVVSAFNSVWSVGRALSWPKARFVKL